MVLPLSHDPNDPLLDLLARNLRALRARKRWSRRELAARADISERFLADVEAARANPSLLRLATLARVLDVGLVALLTAVDGEARRHVALLGLRGAGKSTIGPLLGVRLGIPFVELDTRIEAATGLQLGEIFQLHGESYYRATERAELQRVLAGPPCVLAVGGGLVTDPQSFAALRQQARTVWLRAAPEQHWERVIAQGDTRPMANNAQAFRDLRRILAEREPYYREAEWVVDTSHLDVDGVVADLVASLTSPAAARAARDGSEVGG